MSNYIANFNKWYSIEENYFIIDSENKKYNEEMNCYQEQYEDAT